eukprot:gnl/MRDRNA2_/MRDRNA2_36507_c0_seq1.p1 gnl/MRDRNA2_/MRDRNA2_36507_c0~~gnl/MRDRNA2_/MRDRNA2_36507_c0_seq1.p1  ORF type:complete len:1023 (-),score=176.27 gnl/MRDRNA2_/MRDRNA2_36507_c0_seq1:99-3167(-)
MNKGSILTLASCLSIAMGMGATHQLHVHTKSELPRRTFDGIGALSAGASSRLLQDYPEKERKEILDLLFLPGYGASLQILKVEIGGDMQSTDGSEPSHMRFSGEKPVCERGYETWLLAEAKKRNPAIVTQGLSWGVPGWIGNGNFFSEDNLQYQVSWVSCIREKYGFEIDYLGIWNESPWGEVWYIDALRSKLDSKNLSTKLVLLDEILGADEGFVKFFEQNKTFRKLVDAVGLHYPCNKYEHLSEALKARPETRIWASEEVSTVADWGGAGCWGRLINQNFIRLEATSSIAWSLIWSAYPNLECFGNGLMYAFEPWSGHYEVRSPVWATAHTTQFTAVGWEYIPVGDGSGELPEGGTHVALVSPDGLDITMVFETLRGQCFYGNGCFHETEAQRTQRLRLHLELPSAANRSLFVWLTNETHQFVPMHNVESDKDGIVEVSVPVDSVMTLTTVGRGSPTLSNALYPQNQLKATTESQVELNSRQVELNRKQPAVSDLPKPPKSKEFPLPFFQNFDRFGESAMPHFFADQGGAFEVIKADSPPSTPQTAMLDTSQQVQGFHSSTANQVLEQQITITPIAWHGYSPEPWTLVGGVNWTDISAEVSAKLGSKNEVKVGDHSDLCVRLARYHFFGSHTVGSGDAGSPPEGYCIRVVNSKKAPRWELSVASVPLDAGYLSGNSADAVRNGGWLHLRLDAKSARVKAWVDGVQVSDIIDTTYPIGQVALKCGYHRCQFDNLSVQNIEAPVTPAFTDQHSEGNLIEHVQLATFDYNRRTCDPAPTFAKRRHDLDGWAGFAFRPRKDMAVVSLGNMVADGRRASDINRVGQNISLFCAHSGRVIASVLQPVGKPAQWRAGEDGWIWSDLKVPVRIERQREYFIVAEVSKDSGESFYDNSISQINENIIPRGPVYFESGSWMRLHSSRDAVYGPVSARLADVSVAPRPTEPPPPPQSQASTSGGTGSGLLDALIPGMKWPWQEDQNALSTAQARRSSSVRNRSRTASVLQYPHQFRQQVQGQLRKNSRRLG